MLQLTETLGVFVSQRTQLCPSKERKKKHFFFTQQPFCQVVFVWLQRDGSSKKKKRNMSSWLSFESFLYSRTATWCRYGLAAFAIFGVGSDYYLTHYYEAFDPKEGRRYVVDWSPIGKPRCQMLLIPNNHYTNYSPWTPRNGDVVIAREVEDEPNYLQLLNGRFVERQTCGVPLMRPVEEVEAEAQREKQQREALLSLLASRQSNSSAHSSTT